MAASEKEKDTSPFEHLVHMYQVLGEVIANAKGGFAADFCGPYFHNLADRKLSEPFVAYAWQSANLDGAGLGVEESGKD